MSLIYGFLRLSQAGFYRFFLISRGCERYHAQTPQYKGNRGCDITPQPRGIILAERQGFEPWEALTSTVFKTAAFDHSATSPLGCLYPFFGANASPKPQKSEKNPATRGNRRFGGLFFVEFTL